MKPKNFLEFSEERRKKLSQRELDSNVECVPIAIFSVADDRRWASADGKLPPEAPPITVKRFLINRGSLMFQAISTVQSKWDMTEKEKGVFMYTRNPTYKLVNMNATVGETYDKFKENDGWLYLLWDYPPMFG